jgi:hypothetical protein
VVRPLSGVVAAGVFVLTLIVVGTAIVAARREFPGPGGASVTWHLAASAIAVVAQIFSDKHRGFAAFSGSVVVFLVAGLLLWTQWWN